jgi:hypothetical protein
MRSRRAYGLDRAVSALRCRVSSSKWLFFAALLLAVSTVSTGAQHGTPPTPAIPREPIETILDAYRSHPLVALCEGEHGNEQGHAFVQSLIRDARFQRTVNDVVVEFGNARYQDVMDRFVGGQTVPNNTLRQAWQNTTQPNTVWDKPVYEEFFRTVRAVNASIPRDKHVRVLLGDPPIDWDVAEYDRSKWKEWMGLRDRYPAEVVQKDVLAKKRRALLIYGGSRCLHFQRKNVDTNYDHPVDLAYTLASLLERDGVTKLFTIWTNTNTELPTLQPDVAYGGNQVSPPLRGTMLGAADFTSYIPVQSARATVRDGKPVVIPRDQWRSMRMEDQFDAILYLGPPSAITFAAVSRATCCDPDYIDMRTKRLTLFGMRSQVDELKRTCGITQ